MYTTGNWLLLFELGVAVGVVLWVTERTGNTINEMNIALLIFNKNIYIYIY